MLFVQFGCIGTTNVHLIIWYRAHYEYKKFHPNALPTESATTVQGLFPLFHDLLHLFVVALCFVIDLMSILSHFAQFLLRVLGDPFVFDQVSFDHHDDCTNRNAAYRNSERHYIRSLESFIVHCRFCIAHIAILFFGADHQVFGKINLIIYDCHEET